MKKFKVMFDYRKEREIENAAIVMSDALYGKDEETWKTIVPTLEKHLGVKVDAMLMKAVIWGAFQLTHAVELGVRNQKPPERIFQVCSRLLVNFTKAKNDIK